LNDRIMLDLYDELKSLIAIFDRSQIPYALCGGLAMAVHGIPRATIDIDVLITNEALASARSAARQLGYTIIAAPMSFADGKVQIHRISKIDPDSRDILMLDLLLVTDSLLEVWKAREQLEWENGSLWVVSRSGLIALKQLRRSSQDLTDIAQLTEESDET
jgi:hypothetical protein